MKRFLAGVVLAVVFALVMWDAEADQVSQVLTCDQSDITGAWHGHAEIDGYPGLFMMHLVFGPHGLATSDPEEHRQRSWFSRGLVETPTDIDDPEQCPPLTGDGLVVERWCVADYVGVWDGTRGHNVLFVSPDCTVRGHLAALNARGVLTGDTMTMRAWPEGAEWISSEVKLARHSWAYWTAPEVTAWNPHTSWQRPEVLPDYYALHWLNGSTGRVMVETFFPGAACDDDEGHCSYYVGANPVIKVCAMHADGRRGVCTEQY